MEDLPARLRVMSDVQEKGGFRSARKPLGKLKSLLKGEGAKIACCRENQKKYGLNLFLQCVVKSLFER